MNKITVGIFPKIYGSCRNVKLYKCFPLKTSGKILGEGKEQSFPQ